MKKPLDSAVGIGIILVQYQMDLMGDERAARQRVEVGDIQVGRPVAKASTASFASARPTLNIAR